MTKTTRPKVRIHNMATDEVIDREMDDQEFAAYEAELAANAAEQAELVAKQNAKAAILDRIGLTADELKTILG